MSRSKQGKTEGRQLVRRRAKEDTYHGLRRPHETAGGGGSAKAQ